MRRHRERQSLQVIAAFEQADEAAPGMTPGALHQLPGRPVEIVLDQIDLGQRVPVVRIEAGRDDDQVGRGNCRCAGSTRRQERLAEIVAAAAGRERRVEDVAGARLASAPVPG